MSTRPDFDSYFDCIGDLLTHDTVCAHARDRHPFFVTCYDHSVFVSYVASVWRAGWGPLIGPRRPRGPASESLFVRSARQKLL
jgi:hypothetical protein